MRVAFGTDETSEVTEQMKAHLESRGHDLVALHEDVVWTDVGRNVGEVVAKGGADMGVVCCWTGTGVSIAANKVPGVRAALCTDAVTAEGARRWNDANVLAMGLRLTSAQAAREMIDAFLAAGPDPDEAATIAAID